MCSMPVGSFNDKSFNWFEDKSKTRKSTKSWNAICSMFPKIFDETFKYRLRSKVNKSINHKIQSNYVIHSMYRICRCKSTYSDGYEKNVLYVITVILLPDKFKLFKRKYLFWLLSLRANSKLLAAFNVSILGDASSICDCLGKNNKKWLIEKKRTEQNEINNNRMIVAHSIHVPRSLSISLSGYDSDWAQ